MAAAFANNTTDYACMSVNESDPAIMLSNKILFAASLFFTAVGLAGNSLSVTVFSSAPMRKVSSNVYLLTLAVSDALYLISVFLMKTLVTLRCWYFVESAIDLMNRSSVACVLLQYITDLFSDFSTCLILAFTVERYIAVYLPTKFKYLCTVSRARLTCSAILVVVAIFIAPYHVMYVGILENFNVCAVFFEHEARFTILYAVESFLFRILPITVIAILNVFIIFRVSKIKQKRNRMMTGKSDAHSQLQQQHHHHEDSSLQLTIMLILVSTTYIVLDIPVLAHFVILKLTLSEIVNISHKSIVVSQNCTRILFIAGYAVNFFLYTVSGKVFRQQLVSLLTVCCRRKQSHTRRETDALGDKMSPLIEKR